MKRREFLHTATMAGLAGCSGLVSVGGAGALSSGGRKCLWQRRAGAALFESVACAGRPLLDVAAGDPLLEAECRVPAADASTALCLGPARAGGRQGPIRAALAHRLRSSHDGPAEDVLEATLRLENTTDRPVAVAVAFLTAALPAPGRSGHRGYLPLSASGLNRDKRFAALGVTDFLQDCNQPWGDGRTGFRAHYLEPMASCPDERRTRALLLAPVVDVEHPDSPLRVALFTRSDRAVCFTDERRNGRPVRRVLRTITLPPKGASIQRCWLLIHTGDAAVAWSAFHRLAHEEAHPPIDWIRRFRVHYYDFLSSAAGQNGHRGDGYEADLPLFRAFHVGMATQHGYYPTLGDYIHPDRKTWKAMRGDRHGAVTMSFEKMQARIRATRAAGAKAAVYIHPVLFDDASPLFKKMRDCVLVGADGRPVPFPWKGPDTVGRNWRASLASAEWREHLLQQVGWIMDLLRPDAITVDETFAGIGYDHHPDRAGPMSAAAIDWHRRLRALVRSFGEDKAVFTSDCSMSPFVLWADGEVGDHAYGPLLGNPLYRQEPVRYLAALGDKPWRPCAWHFRHMWKLQMALARQVGAGVGVSNGWLEYTGLQGLRAAERQRLIADIETLL